MDTSEVPLGGTVAPGFEAVREAFTTNFVERGEVGAAVSVRVHGEVVVDLWGGWADQAPHPAVAARHPWVTGPCPVLGEEGTFGLGFIPTNPRRSFFANPHSFGHFGTGGAVGCADPDAGVAFGYVMNHVIPRWQSSRNRALLDTLAACL